MLTCVRVNRYIALEDAENTALSKALDYATRSQLEVTDNYIPVQVDYLRYDVTNNCIPVGVNFVQVRYDVIDSYTPISVGDDVRHGPTHTIRCNFYCV